MNEILVIREFGDFSRILAANSFKIISLPLIETETGEDLSDFETKLKAIENYDGIFLTSKTAARILVAVFFEKNIKFTGKVYVLGRQSFEILQSFSILNDKTIDLVFDEAANTAREMLENTAREDLKNKRFLFVRGEESLRIIPDYLAEIAAVDETIVYRTKKISVESSRIKAICEKFGKKEIACACFFSPSAAQSFIEQFGAAILHQTLIAAIGKTTADFFETLGLKVDFVSRKVTTKDFAVGLMEFLNNGGDKRR